MKRKIFNQLVEWKNQKERMPLIVNGARQIGKTFSINEFGEKEFTNTFLWDAARTVLEDETWVNWLDERAIANYEAGLGTIEDAQTSLIALTATINALSTTRASLGAIQNRMEFKIQNLDNSAENLAAAESRIRDVDMAKQMTEFTKNNILFQASTAMLAQANALPQGVLQLLG